SAWILEVEKPIGFLVVHDKINECEIMNIAVLPQCQRKGYGQQLLAHAMAYAESKNFSRLCLEVRASNAAAISLYHAAGFIDVGLRKNYYPKGHEREDAVLMTLVLTAHH
ncbi:MAG: ribosomal protein S18-alanine N-acetyltransferase, partial [Coxiellaceae bacterium]|nr:ribosomal protein S18-alanine N-acetyltransferase [Coxiellaceae bacterium]